MARPYSLKLATPSTSASSRQEKGAGTEPSYDGTKKRLPGSRNTNRRSLERKTENKKKEKTERLLTQINSQERLTYNRAI